MRHVLAFVVLGAILFALFSPAAALERNFAGSAQVDYHFVPTARDARAYDRAFDGTTVELSGKIAVDLSERLSANLKLCFGCHGLEADMMYFDYRVGDELNFRVGRFSPSFGAFNLRHDPANHRLSDKPLPYDMGRMLRMRAWNQGVLPSPFPDNGLEVNGTFWFGSAAQLDYALYGVTGFKSSSNAPADLDFTDSRTLYYVDNNARPTGGARAALTLRLGPSAEATVGASAMAGTYDAASKLWYAIGGADFALRLGDTNIRAEYLVRRTDFDTSNPTAFKYGVPAKNGDYFVKHGAYAELEQPLSRIIDVIARVDGMRRVGNVEIGSELDRDSTVLRYTLGSTYVVERGFRVKGSTELWQFTDKDAVTGRNLEVTFHLGVVGTF